MMDIAVHWGILRHLRRDIHANGLILIAAILLDLMVLGGFLWVKVVSDPWVVGVAISGMIIIAIIESIFLRKKGPADKPAS